MNASLSLAGGTPRRTRLPRGGLLVTTFATVLAGLVAAPGAGAVTVVAPGTASSARVTLSTPAAGATEVSYVIAFTEPRTFSLAATMTVTTPSGTLLPTCGHLTDLMTGDQSDVCGGTGQPEDKRTMNEGLDLTKGDLLRLELDGVRNTGALGPQHLSVEMGAASSDTQTASYTIVKQQSLSDVYVQPSTPAGDATEVGRVRCLVDAGGRGDRSELLGHVHDLARR